MASGAAARMGAATLFGVSAAASCKLATPGTVRHSRPPSSTFSRWWRAQGSFIAHCSSAPTCPGKHGPTDEDEASPRAAGGGGTQQASEYTVWTGDGKPSSTEQVLEASRAYDVVMLGEEHDDCVAHSWQLEFTRRVSMLSRPIALGLEMFERDTQTVLDEYCAGLVQERDLLGDGRAWNNYSDYRPMVEFARSNNCAVLATNAPRRYVSLVGREGLLALSKLGQSSAAHQWLPPLPIAPPSEAYTAQFQQWIASSLMQSGTTQGEPPEDTSGGDMVTNTSSDESSSAQGGGGCPYIGFSPKRMSMMLEAQTLWDATMAHAITTYCHAHPDELLVHINGSFHSRRGLGVVERVQAQAPSLRVLVVTLVSDEHFTKGFPSEMLGDGDFIVRTNACLAPSFEIEHPV